MNILNDSHVDEVFVKAYKSNVVSQIATLNAIANYFNYKTWQDYKADKIKNGFGKISFVQNGSHGLTVAQLQENSIDVTEDKRYHYIYFPGKMNVPSDNFKFKTRVKMHEARQSGIFNTIRY